MIAHDVLARPKLGSGPKANDLVGAPRFHRDDGADD